jgi:hypothetical protein
VGDAASQLLTVSNTAPAGAFSEALNASFSGTSGNASGSGGVLNLAAGASNSSAMSVGLDTSSAGARSGTVTIGYQSDGTGPNGNSGLAAIAAGTQVINVSGNVYRLASASTIAPVNFGSVHVGDVVTQALSITNTALNDGFSEKLDASFGGVSDARITTSGSISLLGAGATNSTSMVVGLNTANAGNVAGTATVVLTSDGTGTSGLGTTGLPSQSVSVIGSIGSVFRLAQPSAHSPEPVNFGNVRVGTATNQNLTISNTAANDGFSEKLDASMGGATAGITAGGSFTLLAPQATDSTSLHVGIDTTTAGAKSGTATITLASNGQGTSGLGITPLPSQTVNVSGNVYNMAVGSATPTPVVFANRHVGDAASQLLIVSNTAPSGAFSEALNAAFSGTSGNASGSGSVLNLAAGASNGSAMSVNLDTSTAGARSGTVTIGYQSDGTGPNGNSGLSAIAAGTQVINVSGNVYRLASANTIAPVSFGSVHVGDVVTQALSITNTALNDGFSEKLDASFGAVSDPRITTSGSISLLGAGATNNTSMVIGLNTSAPGNVSGTATVLLQSDGAGTSGLGATSLPSQPVGVTAAIGSVQVFRLAEPSAHTPEPVNFGNVRVGTVTNQNLSITNQAANDGFSEKLDASMGGRHGGHHRRRLLHAAGAAGDRQHEPARRHRHVDRRREERHGDDHAGIQRPGYERPRHHAAAFADRQRVRQRLSPGQSAAEHDEHRPRDASRRAIADGEHLGDEQLARCVHRRPECEPGCCAPGLHGLGQHRRAGRRCEQQRTRRGSVHRHRGHLLGLDRRGVRVQRRRHHRRARRERRQPVGFADRPRLHAGSRHGEHADRRLRHRPPR